MQQIVLPPIILKSRNRKMADCQSYYQPNLPNQSQQSRSSAMANDMSSAVRRTAKCGMQNLQPSCNYHHSGGFMFVYW